MKFKINKLFKKRKVLIGLSLTLTAIVSILVVVMVIFPKFLNYFELRDQTKVEEARLATITANVASLAQVDRSRVEDFDKLVEALSPIEDDTLRALAIARLLTIDAGLVLSSITIDSLQAKKTITPTNIEPNPAETSQAAPEAQPADAKGAKIEVTALGQYASAFRLLELVETVRREMQVLAIKISHSAGAETSIIKFTFTFPLGNQVTAVDPEERVALTSDQVNNLEDLLTKLTRNATSSSQPVGKENPF